jgi:hypothetical protein
MAAHNIIQLRCESKSAAEVPTDPLPFSSCQTPDTKTLAVQPLVSVQANPRTCSFDSASNCLVLPAVAFFGLPLAILRWRKAVYIPPRKLTRAAIMLMVILVLAAREIVALTLPPSQVTADVAAGQLPTASEAGKEFSTTARHAAFAELHAEKDALVKQLAELTKQLAKSIKDKERLANELVVADRDNDRLSKQLADLKLQCRVRDSSTAHAAIENQTDLAGAVPTQPTATSTSSRTLMDMPTTEPPVSASPTVAPMLNQRKASKTFGRHLLQSSSANTHAHNQRMRVRVRAFAVCHNPHPAVSTQISFACRADACGGVGRVALGPSPLVLSDGPGVYANNLECIWLIEASGPINIDFNTFDTEENYDILVIIDGSGDERHFSGPRLPASFTTRSSNVTVKFTSDNGFRFFGFELVLYTLGPGGALSPTGISTASPTWSPDSSNPPLFQMSSFHVGEPCIPAVYLSRVFRCSYPQRTDFPLRRHSQFMWSRREARLELFLRMPP